MEDRKKESDLQALYSWLKQEEAEGIPGNFLCNWTIIKKRHQEAGLTVFVEGNHGMPVALLDFVDCLESALGLQARRNYMPMQAGDVVKTWADVSALAEWVGFRSTGRSRRRGTRAESRAMAFLPEARRGA